MTGASESEPSIAAVTGSMDRNLATYAAEVQLQPHRLEIIQASKSSFTQSHTTGHQVDPGIKRDVKLMAALRTASGFSWKLIAHSQRIC